MKIFFLAPSIKTGGGNRVFIELANQLCDKHDITVIYPNNSTEGNTFCINEKVRYWGIGILSKHRIRKIWNMLRCISFLNENFIDAKVIISDPIFCLFIPFFRNKKRVYRFIQADDYRIYDDGKLLGCGFVLSLYKKCCLKSYRNKAINYIFNSRFVYNKFCVDSHRNDVPYKLVYPAINHAVFKPVEKDTNSFNVFSLCLVARKHPLKGLTTFINVYHSMPPEMKKRISHVTLVSHDDLSEFDTTGMEILKPAYDEDIARVYQKSDIFISTSWWEGFGLPPLEAMACGCAVITSKSGGVNEFAIDNTNCLMYKPKSEEELLEKISILLNNNMLRRRLSQMGIMSAAGFSWENSASQLLDILSE